MQIDTYTPFNPLSISETDAVRDFLHTHLDQYGDTLSAIQKALDYAAGTPPRHGGHIIVARDTDSNEVIGVVVVNKTGMDEYIPENILVYIAIHNDHRGKGIGRKIMEQAIKESTGDIALHVEKDNPARFLYEKLGFTNPYIEMRLKR